MLNTSASELLFNTDWTGILNPETGNFPSGDIWTLYPQVYDLILHNTAYIQWRELIKGKGVEEPKFYYVSKSQEELYQKQVGEKAQVAQHVDYNPNVLQAPNFRTLFFSSLNTWAASVIRSVLILQGKGIEIPFSEQKCVCMADVDIIRPFPEDLYQTWCAKNVDPLSEDFLEPLQAQKQGKPGVYLIDWGSADAFLNLSYAYASCADAQAYSIKGDGVKTRREWTKGAYGAEKRHARQVQEWIRMNDIRGLC